MTLDFVKRVIDEAHSLGVVTLVVFTGGEPFLLADDLYAAVKHAAGKGLLVRIVTKAYWATSIDRACAILSRLRDAGLTEINYSCDDFHQESIPIEQILWAHEAAIRADIPVLIASKRLRNSTITPECLDRLFGAELAVYRKGKANPRHHVVIHGLTMPVGWDSESLSDDDLMYCDQETALRRPCKSVLENIVITPIGWISSTPQLSMTMKKVGSAKKRSHQAWCSASERCKRVRSGNPLNSAS
jgi:hypothetical protein